MPARKSRWAEQHAFCQETISRQRTEIEQLRERVAALEADAGKDARTIAAGGALYGG